MYRRVYVLLKSIECTISSGWHRRTFCVREGSQALRVSGHACGQDLVSTGWSSEWEPRANCESQRGSQATRVPYAADDFESRTFQANAEQAYFYPCGSSVMLRATTSSLVSDPSSSLKSERFVARIVAYSATAYQVLS